MLKPQYLDGMEGVVMMIRSIFTALLFVMMAHGLFSCVTVPRKPVPANQIFEDVRENQSKKFTNIMPASRNPYMRR